MTRQYHKHQCAVSLKFYTTLTLGLVFRFSYTASQIQSTFCEPLLIPASLPGKKVKVKVAQSCRTRCDPVDYAVHGILQTRILEWVACPFSRGSSQPRNWTRVSSIAGGSFTNWAMRKALGVRALLNEGLSIPTYAARLSGRNLYPYTSEERSSCFQSAVQMVSQPAHPSADCLQDDTCDSSLLVFHVTQCSVGNTDHHWFICSFLFNTGISHFSPLQTALR